MSAIISWVLEVEILPGKLDDFRAVAGELTESTRKEPGALIYEWFLSADGTACHIYERYQDSAALITHVSGFGPFAERFMASCRPTRFTVYGEPSDEAKATIADLGPVYLKQIAGFNR